MPISEFIDIIKIELRSKSFVEIPADNPFRFYRRLYEAQKCRGLAWKFATTEKSVVVYRKQKSPLGSQFEDFCAGLCATRASAGEALGFSATGDATVA